MLDLTILRGPLQPPQNEEILREVNRLTNSRIALMEFCRWMQDGPDGPAFHAILHSDQRIVGHFSLMPLRASFGARSIPVARTEYFFVHEDFRADKVRGFEDSFLSPAIILLDRLYSHCHAYGWGPFLASAAEPIHPFHELAGCRPVGFPLHECLLALRPWQAARRTPNLKQAPRAGLFGISLLQSTLWHAARPALPHKPRIKTLALDQVPFPTPTDGIELFRDRESLRWRYPAEDYICLSDASDPVNYVIAKNGSEDRYLRICQWQLHSIDAASRFIYSLVAHAQAQRSLGVRWSVFENGGKSSDLLWVLRKHAFLCTPRVRKLLIYSEDPMFLDSSIWKLSDSLFCFDL